MISKTLRNRITVLIISAAGASILTRLLLMVFPEAGGSPVLGVQIHHLLTGILLICVGGVPAVLLRSADSLNTIAVAVFGFGLGLALDEWVLFVLRETAPETPYMASWSVVGAAILVSLLILYTLAVGKFSEAREQQ